MKFIILVSVALFSLAYAVDEPIPIVKQNAEVNFDGSFHSSYETGNGIFVQEEGVLKNAGQQDVEAQEVHGSYSWTAPDGQAFSVKYVANENGFQPEGAHLPEPQQIPEAILRSIKYNEEHPEQNE